LRALLYSRPVGTKNGACLAWLRHTLAELAVQPTNQCVLHPFAADSGGYCKVILGGQHIRMHVAVLLLAGRTPSQHTRHLCGRPGCVNPAHVIPGTAKQNGEDRVRHGTALRGEAHPHARLTSAQVEEIKASQDTQTALAERYGVSQAWVSNVRSGKRRAHG
jgi:hypothetical protein